MPQLELHSWFLEPIPQNSNRWTNVRVWGLPTSTTSRKWWRSSSIRTRISANHLQTRHGTFVRLHGSICKRYATALRMPEHTIRSFARGFPKTWKQLLAQPATATRRSHRIASINQKQPQFENADPNAPEEIPEKRATRSRAASAKQTSTKSLRSSSPSRAANGPHGTSESSHQPKKLTRSSRPTRPCKPTRSSKPPKPPTSSPKPHKTLQKPAKAALKASRLPNPSEPERVKKPSRKRVAFVDLKQSKPSVPTRPPSESTPAKVARAGNWSQAQKDAFERQRNIVPADDPDYWTEVAAGVDGKTAEDCQNLWETSWVSPAARKKKGDFIKPPKSPKVSTPEVVMHVRKAATRKRSRNTCKYRSGVRRLAETIARETNDDLLEPEIVTPKLSGVSLREGVGKVPAFDTEGTPGTEVRRKREKVNQDGELVTPEILARGKAFGLQEADKYVSLFKRRLGTCVIPSLKKDEGKSKKSTEVAGFLRPKFSQTRLLPLKETETGSDNESQNSEDSDLFF